MGSLTALTVLCPNAHRVKVATTPGKLLQEVRIRTDKLKTFIFRYSKKLVCAKVSHDYPVHNTFNLQDMNQIITDFSFTTNFSISHFQFAYVVCPTTQLSISSNANLPRMIVQRFRSPYRFVDISKIITAYISRVHSDDIYKNSLP
jgi:hypothetical protein